MRDWCFRPDCLARFQSAWPRAQVHPLPDVGHWVVEDAPDEAATVTESFLAQRHDQQVVPGNVGSLATRGPVSPEKLIHPAR
jgi:hypothetical protein